MRTSGSHGSRVEVSSSRAEWMVEKENDGIDFLMLANISEATPSVTFVSPENDAEMVCSCFMVNAGHMLMTASRDIVCLPGETRNVTAYRWQRNRVYKIQDRHMDGGLEREMAYENIKRVCSKEIFI